MIDLLAPVALTALAALAIPLLIHLIRRSERQRTPFAALRWVADRTRPRQRLHLHDPLLLMLRLLLLAVLALLLAQPVWREPGADDAKVVAVLPSVSAAAARAAVDAPTADWRWLAAGFPALATDEPVEPSSDADIGLLRQLDAELPPKTTLTVVVPAELSGLDAERLRLDREVDWKIVAGAAPAPAGDTPIRTALTIAVRHGADATDALKVVRALAQAWQTADASLSGRLLLDVADADAAVPAEAAVLIWLVPGTSPTLDAWLAGGGTAFVSPSELGGDPVWLDEQTGEPVLRERLIGTGRAVSLVTALRPDKTAALRDPMFPKALARLLLPMPTAPDRAPAAAVAPVRRDQPAPAPATPLDAGLALAAAVLLLAERLWATRRRRVLA